MASLVQLTNGLMLWNAMTINCLGIDEEYTRGIGFDAKTTAILAPSGKQGELAIVKLSEDIGKPAEVFFPISSILSVRDSTVESLNTKRRAALSGLVLAR